MLSPDELDAIRRTIDDLMSVVNHYQLLERPKQTGVFFCLRHRDEGDETIVHEEVGHVTDEEKRGKYQRVSRRKVQALSDSGLETSWETRDADPQNEAFGGGVAFLAKRLDLSVSGFPEEADTAASLYAAGKAGICSREEAFRIAQKAPGAPIWLRIFEVELGQLAA